MATEAPSTSKKILPWALAILVLGVGLYFGSGPHWSGQAADQASPDPSGAPVAPGTGDPRAEGEIRVGLLAAGGADLVALASAQKLFDSEGLKVKLMPFERGRGAVEKLAVGGVDFVTAGEMPIAAEALGRRGLAVLATISRSDPKVFVLARKDKGIASPPDLKGKKIGADLRFDSLYVVHLFLARQKIADGDVTITEIMPKQFGGALNRGEVDAAADGLPEEHPFLRKVKESATTDLVEMDEPSGYHHFINVVASRTYVTQHPDTAKRVVKALLAAAELAKSKKDDSIRAVAEARSVEGKIIAERWGRITFDVTLDASLVAEMDDEAKWLVDSGKKKKGDGVASMSEVIYPDVLRALKAEAVTLGP
jgi:NitT/TauT family transport system substrate-binding protein